MRAIAAARRRLISSITLAESSIVVESRRGELLAGRELDLFLPCALVETVAATRSRCASRAQRADAPRLPGGSRRDQRQRGQIASIPIRVAREQPHARDGRVGADEEVWQWGAALSAATSVAKALLGPFPGFGLLPGRPIAGAEVFVMCGPMAPRADRGRAIGQLRQWWAGEAR